MIDEFTHEIQSSQDNMGNNFSDDTQQRYVAVIVAAAAVTLFVTRLLYSHRACPEELVAPSNKGRYVRAVAAVVHVLLRPIYKILLCVYSAMNGPAQDCFM